jgi:hypothetical protein
MTMNRACEGSWLARVLLWIGAAVTLAMLASVAPAQVRAPITQPELKLTLSTKNWTRCLGSYLMLELQVENIGRAPAHIDPADLWSYFAFAFRGQDAGGPQPLRMGGSGRGSSGGPAKYLSIEPGLSQTFSFRHSLNKGFFDEAGKYTINISIPYYGPGDREFVVDSNDVEFELSDCGVIRESEQQP